MPSSPLLVNGNGPAGFYYWRPPFCMPFPMGMSTSQHANMLIHTMGYSAEGNLTTQLIFEGEGVPIKGAYLGIGVPESRQKMHFRGIDVDLFEIISPYDQDEPEIDI